VRTWIFQGNPDYFDIDDYLATQPSRFVWLVTRYASDMQPGDRVFIYRTGSDAGVIAEGEIIGAPEPRPEDPEALPFWRTDGAGANEVIPRAQLRLVKTANSREILRRDWLLEDPVLRELPNLKMAAGTNYPIEPASRSVSLRFGTEPVATGPGVKALHAYGPMLKRMDNRCLRCRAPQLQTWH
jgi:EVE domain